MAKEKKISIKYLLNDRVKPEIGNDGIERYPLYMQIVYNGINTRIKVASGTYNPPSISGPPRWNMKSYKKNYTYLLPNNEEPDIKKLKKYYEDESTIHFEQSVIEDIVRHESRKDGKNFSFKAFGDKILAYNKIVIQDLNNNFITQLQHKYLEDNLTYRQYINLQNYTDNADEYIVEILKLLPNFIHDISPYLKNLLTAYWLFSLYSYKCGYNIRLYHWYIYSHNQKYLDFLTNLDTSTLETMDSEFINKVGKFISFDKGLISFYFSSLNIQDQNDLGMTTLTINRAK